MGILRRKPKGPSAEERSLARAVPATATVVSAGYAPSSQRTETSAPFDVVLDVAVGGRPPVRRQVTWTVFTPALGDVQAGTELAVTVDPLAPDLVYPPGYPPPGHEQGVLRLEDCRILPAAGWLDGQLGAVDD